MTTFADIILSQQHEERVGLRFEDRSWTWAEVIAEASACAAALSEQIPKPADRQRHIGVLLENVPEYVFWLFAGALSGAAVIGLNASRPPAELASDIDQADIDLVITEEKMKHLVTGTGHRVPDEQIWTIDSNAYEEWLAPHRGTAPPTEAVDPADIALLLFSSGTTGRPKAVIVGQGRLGGLALKMIERTQMREDSVAYLCMPLFHGNAVILNLLPALVVGATVALTRKFTATRFAEEVHKFGATYVNYVGRALSYVLNQPVDPRDATSTLEYAFGTEASEVDERRFSERFGCKVVEGYGLTEGVFRIGRTPDSPVGSLGRPQEGTDVRIYDEETGEECPRARFDEQGKIVNPEAVGQMVAVGMAHLFEGYYKNPAADAERVRGNDFWSGDLGYRDEEGWFYFAGRSSDWIRVDGENFAAAQVERVLQHAPGVAAAPVFAVADPRTGDQVMTVIEPEPGAAFSIEKLGEFLEAEKEFGAKWWPRFVRVLETLPLTGSGKLDKAPLRKVAWNVPTNIYERVGKTHEYVAVDAARRKELEEEFLEQGRAALLPAQAA